MQQKHAVKPQDWFRKKPMFTCFVDCPDLHHLIADDFACLMITARFAKHATAAHTAVTVTVSSTRLQSIINSCLLSVSSETLRHCHVHTQPPTAYTVIKAVVSTLKQLKELIPKQLCWTLGSLVNWGWWCRHQLLGEGPGHHGGGGIPHVHHD